MCINCDDNTTDIPVGNDGEPGATGSNGLFGGFCGKWLFSTSTATGPTSTFFRFNNTTYSSVTNLYISDTNFDSLNYDAFLDSFDNGGSFGYVRIYKEFDNTKFWLGTVTSVTDNGADHTIGVTYILSNGTFSASDALVVCFDGKGSLPTINQQRITTVFRQSDVPYISTTSASFQEAGILVWDQTTFGDPVKVKVVVTGASADKAFRIKITDTTGTIMWNTAFLTSGTVPATYYLGTILLTPASNDLNYFKVEYLSNGVDLLKLHSIDFYNK